MSKKDYVRILGEQIERLFTVDIPEMIPSHHRTEITLVHAFIQSTPSESFMEKVVQQLLPNAHLIYKKRDEFFTEMKFDIFQDLPIPSQRLEEISVWWKEGKINNEHKQTLWDYFKVFVTLGEQYKKCD